MGGEDSLEIRSCRHDVEKMQLSTVEIGQWHNTVMHTIHRKLVGKSICMYIYVPHVYSWIERPTDFRCPALKFEPRVYMYVCMYVMYDVCVATCM